MKKTLFIRRGAILDGEKCGRDSDMTSTEEKGIGEVVVGVSDYFILFAQAPRVCLSRDNGDEKRSV